MSYKLYRLVILCITGSISIYLVYTYYLEYKFYNDEIPLLINRIERLSLNNDPSALNLARATMLKYKERLSQLENKKYKIRLLKEELRLTPTNDLINRLDVYIALYECEPKPEISKIITEYKLKLMKLKKEKDQFDQKNEFIKNRDRYWRSSSQGFLTGNVPIEGTFKDSATLNSKLNVQLLFRSYKDMKIQLFEYQDSVSIVAYSKQLYIIKVEDSSGLLYKLHGFTNKDQNQVSLYKKSAIILHNILKQNGVIHIHMIETSLGSEYFFDIESSNYYYHYKKLHSIK